MRRGLRGRAGRSILEVVPRHTVILAILLLAVSTTAGARCLLECTLEPVRSCHESGSKPESACIETQCDSAWLLGTKATGVVDAVAAPAMPLLPAVELDTLASVPGPRFTPPAALLRGAVLRI